MHTLDVRVDTRIKAQNLLITERMGKSIQLQIRLQGLVEGLSVIAAAYFLIGLVAFIVKGSYAWMSGSLAEVVIAAVTLPTVFLIYLFVHRTKGSLLSEDKDDSH